MARERVGMGMGVGDTQALASLAELCMGMGAGDTQALATFAELCRGVRALRRAPAALTIRHPTHSHPCRL